MATDPSQIIGQLLSNTGFGQTAQQIASANLANQQGQQNLQAGNQVMQLNQMKLQQAQVQARQDALREQKINDWVQRGSNPAELSQLAAEFPEYWQAFSLSYKAGNEEAKRADLGFYGGIRSLLDAKKPDLQAVRTMLSQRRQAMEKAGEDTAILDRYIQAIDAKDMDAIAGLKGLATASMAATDPDQFGQIFKTAEASQEGYTLSPGARRFDAEGNLIAEAPFAPRPVTVGEGQTVVEYDPNAKGGDPASGTGVIGGMLAVTPFSESGNREYNADGTRVTSPKGARGVMQVMPRTADNPGYGIAPSNGTPEDDARLGREYLTKMFEIYGNPAQAWAAYNAGPGAVDAAIQKGGANWLQQMPKETQQYVAKNMVALRRQGEGAQGAGARVIAQGAPKQEKPPSGYRWKPDGTLEPIPGGPGTKGGAADAKQEGLLRREFNTLPEVKDFKDVRANYLQVKALAEKKNPTASDDIALVFSYMKMLDPGSVVREGEYATAQNATGVPEQIMNLYNRVLDGNRLNANQRANMIGSAGSVYVQRRNTYNATADRYRGIAEDYGYDPGRIAPLALTPEELKRRRAESRGQPQQQTRPQFRIVGRRPAR